MWDSFVYVLAVIGGINVSLVLAFIVYMMVDVYRENKIIDRRRKMRAKIRRIK